MRTSTFVTAASAFLLVVSTGRGLAQTTDPFVASPSLLASSTRADPQAVSATGQADAAQQADELRRWMEAFVEWREWWAKWANRREPGWFASSRPRRQKPAPPDWLPARCENVIADTDPLAQACALLEEWRQDPLLLRSRSAQVAAVQNKEDDRKTTWWEHIHVDVLWPATELRASVYGVVGFHTAAAIRGRLQVFLAPGVMLLNLPTADGTRVWKVAANYGIGYRLLDFTFPGGRPASLHVNIAKSWLVSDARDLVTNRNLDFAGFSVTFKRR